MAKQTILDLGPQAKVCGGCEIRKPLDEFHKRSGGRPRSHCKPCHAAYTRMYNARAAKKNKNYYYWTSMKRLYGLTPEAWQKIYDSQNGLCALCRLPERSGAYRTLNVDHCHVTGRVRGFLCNSCNTALAILGDQPDGLKRALDYVS